MPVPLPMIPAITYCGIPTSHQPISGSPRRCVSG